jgi:hypothetical protein
MRKRKQLFSTKEVLDLHLEVFLTYCGKLLIDASWFGTIGDNSATLFTEQTEMFNKHTEWNDEIAIELYNLASKEYAE